MKPGGPTGGAVLIARAMQDSAVWGMPEHYLKLWLYLLLNVRWDEKPHRIGPVSIGYGQVLKSYRVIADECQYTHNRQVKRWSTSQVKAVLGWLEAEGMVETLGTELGTLITVRNFKKYQAFSTYAAPDSERDSEQPKNNLEQPKNNRKQEETGGTTTPPPKKRAHRLPEEWTPNATHQKIADEEKVGLIREAETFRNHAAANDRRQVDWDASFCNWLRKANKYGGSRGRRNAGGSASQGRSQATGTDGGGHRSGFVIEE